MAFPLSFVICFVIIWKDKCDFKSGYNIVIKKMRGVLPGKSLFSVMFRSEVEVWFVVEAGGAFLVVAPCAAQESTAPKWMRMGLVILSGLFDVVRLIFGVNRSVGGFINMTFYLNYWDSPKNYSFLFSSSFADSRS